MGEERPACRICLISRNSKSNPLLSPCDCRGSVQYVHLQCLNHWRYLDIEQNGERCELCNAIYIIHRVPVQEIIPSKDTPIAYILRFPITVSVGIHYIVLLAMTFQYPPFQIRLPAHEYILWQDVFMFCYFCLLSTQFKVRQFKLYRKVLHKQKTWLLFLSHFLSLYAMHEGYLIFGPLSNLLLGFYWSIHTETLQEMNSYVAILG